MTDPPEILETARLRLRKPVLQDAEEIFRQYAQDPEVTKYLTWKPNRHANETRDFLRAVSNDHRDSYCYAITR